MNAIDPQLIFLSSKRTQTIKVTIKNKILGF